MILLLLRPPEDCGSSGLSMIWWYISVWRRGRLPGPTKKEAIRYEGSPPDRHDFVRHRDGNRTGFDSLFASLKVWTKCARRWAGNASIEARDTDNGRHSDCRGIRLAGHVTQPRKTFGDVCSFCHIGLRADWLD